jgi:hypothetical protein
MVIFMKKSTLFEKEMDSESMNWSDLLNNGIRLSNNVVRKSAWGSKNIEVWTDYTQYFELKDSK